ncbi:ABC transporter permease [Frankia sp. CNm7]|uniref:ABC transporter permease n=1 Tax=Frankia nepalensis TaxID=1836974 RepID=A0A937RK71_9ACTN|nr:ABC transporter permease [Frankia nepalensis]MBL7508677.1 ABC transporter permease [Frankia nepalensis]MBL7519034.1 ABC transporter permease [Frankia nepalensis]MBL7628839.1 ABC transporter permease [Frankia nepalensis]
MGEGREPVRQAVGGQPAELSGLAAPDGRPGLGATVAAAAGLAPAGLGVVPAVPDRTPFPAAFAAVYRGQIARGKVARMPLMFVATLQSVGILALLRGVVDIDDAAICAQVVAGCTVLVVAFVALNLLAQRFGALRAAGALDYYLTLPVPGSAVVLGTAASYATFAVPGVVVTAVTGALMFDLPLSGLWVLAPVALLAGASLAGIGAAFGLLAPRPELATIAGQLGMSVVLFAGIIPADRLPGIGWLARDLLPSSYAVDALSATFLPAARWATVALDLGVCALVALVTLAAAAAALRRAGTA